MAATALALLALFLSASLWIAFPSSSPSHAQAVTPSAAPPAADEDDADLLLYQAIIQRVRRGENYYSVAVDEQRHRSYPLQPFVTVRLPTLAEIIAHLGFGAAHLLLISLAGAVLLSWQRQLAAQDMPPQRALALLGLLAAGLTPVLFPRYLTLHEIWAGILVALALGLYRPGNWIPCLIAAACALSIREHALPFVGLMGVLAVARRNWAEAAGWSALIILFVIGMMIHRSAVLGLIQPTDLSSPPWMMLGGFSSALSFCAQTFLARALPDMLRYPLVILSLFGWISWRSNIGKIGALLLSGYMVGFALTGRENNFYWGLMIAPLLGMGLAMARPALADLIQSIRGAKLDSQPV